MVQVFNKMASLGGLSKDDFAEFFARIGDTSPGEVGALLGYLLGRLDANDAAAIVAAIREVHPQRTIRPADGRMTVNLVGTGGGPSTFNISTTTAFLVAAAGVAVIKTGSSACRSRSGFSDVAAKLGTLKLSMPWSQIETIVNEVGIVFVPQLHYAAVLGTIVEKLTPPAYRNAAGYLYKIGPLLSPVRVDHQFIGASSAPCMEMLAGACRLLNDVPTTLVAAEDGLDEVSTRAKTGVINLDANRSRSDMTIDPAAVGIESPAQEELQGHEPAAAAQCCERILSGNGTAAQSQIVALNAAVVLTSLGRFASLTAGYEAAMQLLQSGEALRKLHQLRAQVWKCVKQ